jgi:hypothetical protein
MRITVIKVTEKASIAQYESLEFSAEAVLDDTDNIHEETSRLRNYVNWHARLSIHSAEAKKQNAIIVDANIPENDQRRLNAKAWIDNYAKRKARVEAM